MGVLDFLYRKKKNSSITTENKIEYTNENKVENSLDNLPTDEQIRSVASIGLHTKWLTGITNENLIPMMFEWIDVDCYKKVLRFKTLHSNRINYAPCIILYCDGEEFYYDGDWASNKVTISCGSIGNAMIKYNGPCMVKIIAPYTRFRTDKRNETIQIEDYSDVLEVDYSPEAVKRGEYLKKEIIRKEREEDRRIEIEDIKYNIKQKKRKRELEKQAIQELINEGELFPEANKRPPIPKEVVDTVWNRDGGRCVYCGSTENLHLDHIIPFSKGGDTSVENLQLLCQKCNLQKSNKIG